METNKEITIKEAVQPLPKKLRTYRIYKISIGHHQRGELEQNNKILSNLVNKYRRQTRQLKLC